MPHIDDKKSILIVDDSMEWCMRLKELFLEQNFFRPVATAYDGEQAICYIKENRPDVILLDLIMPNLDGLDLLHQIRNEFRDYEPVIYLISAVASPKIYQLLNEFDIADIATKPVRGEVIVSDITSLIAQRQQKHRGFESVREAIENYVYALGLPLNRIATKQFCTALYLTLKNKSIEWKLSTLMREIAMHHNTKKRLVEKHLRESIHTIRGSNTILKNRIFPCNTERMLDTELFHLVCKHLPRYLTGTAGDVRLSVPDEVSLPKK